MAHRQRKPPQLSIKTRFSHLPSPQSSPLRRSAESDTQCHTSPVLATEAYSLPEVPPRDKVTVNKEHVKRLAYSDPNYMDNDIREAEKATMMVLESRYAAAEAYLKTRHGQSLYFSYGLAALLFQKAIMTFDPEDIAACFAALDDAIQVASILRKSSSGAFLTQLLPQKAKKQTSDFKSMTRIEKHAELVFASAGFIRALLAMITNVNVLTMVREGIKIRTSYLIYKSCYKYIHSIFMEEGQEGFERHGLDEHFIAGVLMGMGGFNLAFSMAPAHMVKLCEWVGFSADRQFAMSCLETGARWPRRDFSLIYPSPKGRPSACVAFDMPPAVTKTNIQSLFCDWLLLMHHTIIATLVPIPEADIPFAKMQLDRRIQQYPKSILYIILEARLNDTMGQMAETEQQVITLIQNQKDWQTLVHGGIWSLGFIKAAQGKWREAAGCFEILYRESKWSPAVYAYMKAVCLYHADKKKYADTIFLTMRMVPTLVRKLAAGQTLPDEKFVTRKAKRFLEQGGRLTLPGYEAIYMLWTGFDCFFHERMPEIITEVDQEIQRLQSLNMGSQGLPYKTYADDLCLAHFLRGLAMKQFTTPFKNTLIPAIELIHEKPSLVKRSQLVKTAQEFANVLPLADQIDKDQYLLPFARFEMALVYQRLGEWSKAQSECKAAARGGALPSEPFNPKKSFSNDLLLGLKVHSLQLKLEILERLVGWKMEKNDDIWAAYSVSPSPRSS